MGITNRQIKYFNIAREMSRLSNFHRQHLGCVVVYKKKHVLSVGVNQAKSHILQAVYNQYRGFDIHGYPASLHAEIDALSKIRHLNIDWSKVELYVYRENRNDGTLAMAYPCRACMRFIVELGIREIYYTTDNGYGFERII